MSSSSLCPSLAMSPRRRIAASLPVCYDFFSDRGPTMARGKKFRPTRRIPDTERSLFEQKLTGRYTRTLDRTDLLNLVRGGEDTHLEFKIRLVNTDKIAAEIVAM